MVNISTRYDNIDGVNTKVFVVRGDEAYARTTDVTVELDSITSNTLGFVPVLTVNVLRDTGNSFITVYDGEESIMTTDWTGSTNATDITLPRLSWGVQHDLWVYYHGNSSCLKSKSETLSLIRENPNVSDTTITNNSSVTSYDSTTSVTLSAKLNRLTGSASLSDKTLIFYVDGVNKGTGQTNSSGVATCSVGRLTNGTRQITVEFEGDDLLGASTVSYNINIGYLVTIEEYPSVFVLHGNNPCKVSVKQYDGTPKSGASVTFIGHTKTTDTNGIASFTITHEMVNGYDYYATYGSYSSETIRANVVTINDLTLTKSKDAIGLTNFNTLNVAITGSNIQANTPITITGDLTETIYTNATGQAVTSYYGTGLGDVSITATSGDGTDTVTFEDLYQYWNTSTGDDIRFFTMENGSVSKLNNGYKFAYGNGTGVISGVFDNYGVSSSEDFELSFDIVSYLSRNPSTVNQSVNPWILYGTSNQLYAEQMSLSKGDKVKLKTDNGYYQLYKNNELVTTQTVGVSGALIIGYQVSVIGDYFTINNLKLKRIE